MDFRFYISLFMRRLPYFLIFVALGSAIGFSLASVLPPTFVAQARLLMEAEQIPTNLASSTVNTDAGEQLTIIEQRIMTRDNLLELANRLKVYEGSPELPADQIVTDMRSRAKIVRQGGGAAAARPGQKQAIIVTVSFQAKSPILAAAVANEFVTLILQESVEMRMGVAGQTLDFFVQEVNRLDKELSSLSAEIIDFQQENKDALPANLSFRQNQLVAEQNRLLQLDRDESDLKDRRAQLVMLFEATGQVGAPTGAQQTPEQRQLQVMQDQLSSALAILAPSNPRIKMLQSQVEAQEKVVAAQLAATSTVVAGQQLTPFEIQLADIDGQLVFLEEQRVQIRAKVDELELSIEATPGVTIALDTLTRDYNNVRQQYDNAVSARARAETGDLIETLSKGQRISVIEQAVAPRSPTSPNRPLIAAGGVGGGMALGLGVVLLLELMNRAIRRPIELTNKLGITPFATLPYMRTIGESRRRSTIIILALMLVLAGIPALLWAVDTYYLPLDLLIERIIDRLGLGTLIDQLRKGIGQ